MLIACLGWGSLVWDQKCLPQRDGWLTDGPFLPIEFARQSKDDHITLVLVPGKPLVRSLWTLLSVDDVEEAREALGAREGVPEQNFDKHIGVWRGSTGTITPTDFEGGMAQRIDKWAKLLMLDAVIWTNLPPGFKSSQGQVPSCNEVVTYLSGLLHEKRKHAERYVRMAPRQIDTNYRRRIEDELHWMSLSSI